MKTLIIIQREYLSRVKKKSFIILTLLIPVLFVGLGALVGVIAAKSGDKKNIIVVDESHLFDGHLENTSKLAFRFENGNLDSLKNGLEKSGADGILYIPPFDVNQRNKFQLFYDEELGLETKASIEDKLNEIVTKKRIEEAGITPEQLKIIESSQIEVKPFNMKEGKESSNEIALVIGYASGFLLYMLMLIYGMNVMRSVMEEKTNRIAEIIVSSVKPFQLMMGKIIGVALVGLTQFAIWTILIFVVTAISGPMLGSAMGGQQMDAMADLQANKESMQNVKEMLSMLGGQNWTSIILWFVFYFLGGYFLYAALFAAVGSLVNEDPQESNQYTLPITLPIILGFVLMTTASRDPHSSLAIFGSIFPFTSPMVMMARVPYGVPAWQMILSAFLLVATFMAITWMAGKIYRTGILLYGKKVTLKELGKWMFRK